MSTITSSIVEYPLKDYVDECGYCGEEKGFVAPRMWAHRLTVQDLQDLTDRGWSSSGKYFYKPDNSKMCCPLYNIRCDALDFKLSKSQKKVLKKLHAYLATGTTKKKLEIPRPLETCPLDTCPPSSDTVPENKGGTAKECKRVPKKGAGPDPTKPQCRKAKDFRRERRELKQSQLGSNGGIPSGQAKMEVTASQDGSKSLEKLLELPTVAENPTHVLDIRLVRSHPASPEFEASRESSYQLYRKYQMSVHKNDPENITTKRCEGFLVDSPLIPETGPVGWDIGFGSYHQQYYLDGRLIMVGVVDILPNCLSSKYLFYDPDYKFLSLGVVSALNELKLVRRLNLANPSFRYFCLGHYNHTCPKIKYKGQYTPSFLLCPQTNEYIAIEKCRPKLDMVKYTKLSDDKEPNEEVKNPVKSYADSTLILVQLLVQQTVQHQIIPYCVLKMATRKDLPVVEEYASLVGPCLVKRMIMVPHTFFKTLLIMVLHN